MKRDEVRGHIDSPKSDSHRPFNMTAPSTLQSSEIRTSRLLLRAAREDDLPAYNKWLSDSESMNYWYVFLFKINSSCNAFNVDVFESAGHTPRTHPSNSPFHSSTG